MKRTLYEVLTWDTNLQQFTPQKGVRRGPYTLFGTRKALRKFGGRPSEPSVLVQVWVPPAERGK